MRIYDKDNMMDLATDAWYILGLFNGKNQQTLPVYVTSINNMYIVGDTDMFDYVQIKRRNVVWMQPLDDFIVHNPNDANDPRNYADIDGPPYGSIQERCEYCGQVHA